jgi:hypothetical protein
VVSKGDHVGADGEQAVGQLRSETPAVGGVLPVDDAERRAELFPQSAEPLLECAAAGGADDVRDEQDPQGSVLVAAGCTSIET